MMLFDAAARHRSAFKDRHGQRSNDDDSLLSSVFRLWKNTCLAGVESLPEAAKGSPIVFCRTWGGLPCKPVCVASMPHRPNGNSILMIGRATEEGVSCDMIYIAPFGGGGRLFGPCVMSAWAAQGFPLVAHRSYKQLLRCLGGAAHKRPHGKTHKAQRVLGLKGKRLIWCKEPAEVGCPSPADIILAIRLMPGSRQCQPTEFNLFCCCL